MPRHRMQVDIEANVGRGRLLYLTQLILEAPELAFTSDVVIVEGIQLGLGQQVLTLQHGNDDAIRQLCRLLGRGPIYGQQRIMG